MKTFNYLLITILFSTTLFAQKSAKHVITDLESEKERYSKIALDIWNFAELGYKEVKSSTLLKKTLEDEGFNIESGVADIPTAFIASYGSGKPIIAFLGEYDALPGLSQKVATDKISAGADAGHACGHHLLGTASTAAAITVKNWLKANNIQGTIRFYGCPAEEGGSGKVYMSRDGLFDDVDIVLDWHPADKNKANPRGRLAIKSAKFRFYGFSAHASSAPDKGRSALDAVESMNYMVNLMREHIPQETRIHYVITDGGKAPNVVPDFAEVYYYCRHPNRAMVEDIFNRLIKASEGAAIGTGTTTNYEIIGGTHEMLQNITLQKLLYDNLLKVGGYTYNEEELEFAKELSKTLNGSTPKKNSPEHIVPFDTQIIFKGNGSSDVGDVSFNAPTGTFQAMAWVPETPGHSWQAVAAGGMTIGTKGMMLAAKTLAMSAIELFSNPKLIKKAQEEFHQARGENFNYSPLIGDRAPALDYRN